jgi:hypothetical protein
MSLSVFDLQEINSDEHEIKETTPNLQHFTDDVHPSKLAMALRISFCRQCNFILPGGRGITHGHNYGFIKRMSDINA